MNEIHNLNLEYLKVLNSILETRSTTVSAKKLGVTQSAISHSLKKLREHLSDDIVFRQGNSLELTTKAQRIKRPLSKWLDQLEDIIRSEEFEPATSTKVFYIATTDIIEQLFAPQMIKLMQKKAPHIQLRFIRWEYDRVESQLLNSSIDLAVGVRSFDSSNVMQRVLYEESFISMARKKHPIFNSKIDLESFVYYPHVMTGPGDGKGAIDNYLEKLNRKRRLLYTVNSFSSAPALIENSDCLLTAPKRFSEHIEKRYKIKLFDTPIHMTPFTLKAYWSKANHKDAANKWIREILYSLTM